MRCCPCFCFFWNRQVSPNLSPGSSPADQNPPGLPLKTTLQYGTFSSLSTPAEGKKRVILLAYGSLSSSEKGQVLTKLAAKVSALTTKVARFTPRASWNKTTIQAKLQEYDTCYLLINAYRPVDEDNAQAVKEVWDTIKKSTQWLVENYSETRVDKFLSYCAIIEQKSSV
ncbi:hypothetical protein COB21_03845 [Candidatus Aerophobetes bacterium]|uniref:Uncharacterized protein n=1 Tax=Aerophobetes bacterium TaxID=2030807 RepID=A0A2A4X2X9_UNCAE|nr:MAG: hypothetical protein COB21_03845 [Candidatus Aerophobetes bacterium]